MRLAVLSTPAVQAPPEVAQVAGASARAGGLSSALRAASGEGERKKRREEREKWIRWDPPVSHTRAGPNTATLDKWKLISFNMILVFLFWPSL